MKYFMRFHLIDGSVVDGATEDEPPSTPEEIENAKSYISNIMMSTGGFMLNSELPNGNWACFPKHGILYVELMKEES